MQICKDPLLCTGCGACAARCPGKCITMTEDAEGFFYPRVDESACLHCDSCVKVCPVNGAPALRNPCTDERCYAFQNTDRAVLAESSSGGFFTAAASTVLAGGGAVYAAVMDSLAHVRHVRITDEAGLAPARKSKYMQSEAWGVYASVREDLRAGREVLFVGTPCQVAAVRSFCGESDSLLTIDLMCHGVASGRVVRCYLDALARRYNSPVQSLQFRHKMNRGGVIMRALFADGTEYTANSLEDPFMRGFNKNLFLRRSCTSCPFAGADRTGDLTIGDFWGLGIMSPTALKTGKGVNFLKVNTPRGEAALARIRAAQAPILEEHRLIEARLRNRTLTRPMKLTDRRRVFFEKLDSGPFEELVASLTADYEAERKRADLRDRIIRKAIKIMKGRK